MDEVAKTAVSCPTCSAAMDAGWVAIWNPIIFQRVRWQPTKPGYGRLRVPQGSHVLLRPRAGGKDARVAMLCQSCGTVVVPPDPTYS